jgi:hypothetical protein
MRTATPKDLRNDQSTPSSEHFPARRRAPSLALRAPSPTPLRVMALATSKRKFYKLLDDLSGSKRASPDTSTTTGDRPSKRSRTLATATLRTGGSRDGPGAPPGRSPSGRTTVRLLSSTFESKAGAAPGGGAPAPNASAAAGPAQAKLGGLPATYAPWSHEQFLERLRSFADVKRWRPKPPPVAEVAWARRGWEVVGEEEVACGFCGRHVVLRLDGGGGEGEGDGRKEDGEGGGEDKWWTVEAEERLVGKYEALVVNGHSEECLWRAAGSKGSCVCSWGVRSADVLQTTFSGSSSAIRATGSRNSSNDIRH